MQRRAACLYDERHRLTDRLVCWIEQHCSQLGCFDDAQPCEEDSHRIVELLEELSRRLPPASKVSPVVTVTDDGSRSASLSSSLVYGPIDFTELRALLMERRRVWSAKARNVQERKRQARLQRIEVSSSQELPTLVPPVSHERFSPPSSPITADATTNSSASASLSLGVSGMRIRRLRLFFEHFQLLLAVRFSTNSDGKTPLLSNQDAELLQITTALRLTKREHDWIDLWCLIEPDDWRRFHANATNERSEPLKQLLAFEQLHRVCLTRRYRIERTVVATQQTPKRRNGCRKTRESQSYRRFRNQRHWTCLQTMLQQLETRIDDALSDESGVVPREFLRSLLYDGDDAKNEDHDIEEVLERVPLRDRTIDRELDSLIGCAIEKLYKPVFGRVGSTTFWWHTDRVTGKREAGDGQRYAREQIDRLLRKLFRLPNNTTVDAAANRFAEISCEAFSLSSQSSIVTASSCSSFGGDECGVNAKSDDFSKDQRNLENAEIAEDDDDGDEDEDFELYESY